MGVFAGTAVVGCGSKGVQAYKDGSLDFGSSGDGADAGAGSNGDTQPVVDSGSDTVPAPVAGDGSHVVIAGHSVELVGSGDDSCTNQAPYWTDRWCAFAKPATSLGNNELWVINATKAAAGVAITCNTTDPNCIRLTSGLLDDQQFHFRVHRFDGDTMIFSEGVSQQASGDIFAWRPGWTAPRKLTSQNGALCIGNKKSTTVLCIDNVMVDAAMTKATLDVHAGRIDDPNGGSLPLLDTVIYATMADGANDSQRYEWDISPDGNYVAWSGRFAVGGLETLKLQKVGDDASRVTVAEDVSAWTISDDMTHWYWLKSFNYDGLGAASGSLQGAPFPAGTPTKSLAAKAGDYFQAGKSKGLLVRTNLMTGVGNLVLMPDRDVPTTVQTLDTKVLNLFDVSNDGTKVMYTKTEDLLGNVLPVFDLYIAQAAVGTPVCTLASAATTFADPNPPKFLSSGNVAVFGRINGVTGEGEGLYVDVGACRAAKFATEIYGWLPVADEGYVYTDDLAAVNMKGEVSLRYAQAANNMLPASGVQVQTRAGLEFAPLLPALSAVMYTVAGGTAADGLYINNKLPFATTPPIAPPDGGTTSPPTDGGGDAPAGDAPPGGDAGTDTGAASDTGGATDADPDAGTAG